MKPEQLVTGSKGEHLDQNFAVEISDLVTDVNLEGQMDKEHDQTQGCDKSLL